MRRNAPKCDEMKGKSKENVKKMQRNGNKYENMRINANKYENMRINARSFC